MYNRLSVPIFVINLKRSLLRKKEMENLLKKINYHIYFIDAVDGKELTKSDIDRVYDEESANKNIGRELSRGEIGCALSHKKIYQTIIDRNINYAIIFEDDIYLDPKFEQVVDQILEQVHLPWELILLGHHGGLRRERDTAGSFWKRVPVCCGYKLASAAEFPYGTYGYMITKKGAEKLLGHLKNISKPIDHLTGDKSLVNLYILLPSIVKIETNLSDNYHSMDDRKMILRNRKEKSILYKQLYLLKEYTKNFLVRFFPPERYQ